MNERDKIIEIINSIIPDRNVFYGEREYTVGDIADALLANGIGDVAEWKRRAEVAERNDKIKEKILREFAVQVSCKACPFRLRCNIEKPPQSNNDYEVCRNNYIQQAEREIEEEMK